MTDTSGTGRRRSKNGYYTLKVLAEVIYNMSGDSFGKQIAVKKKQIAKAGTKVKYRKAGKIVTGTSQYLNQKQLKIIVDHMGDPMDYTFNGKKFIKDKDE
jgi:hypothetical protein